MKKIPEFDLSALSETQQQHMRELTASAQRAVLLYQPQAYRKAMEEAFRYYITHHPEMEYDRSQQESVVQTFLYKLPKIPGRIRRQMGAVKGLFLLVLGLGGAYGFLYLYFNRKKLEVSTGLIFVGLFVLSFVLMAVPMLFLRRRKE